MSHKSWITVSINLALAVVVVTVAFAEPPATPVSDVPAPLEPLPVSEDISKAQALWNQGMEAFVARRYTQAATALSMYVDKYPGFENAVEARFYLGQSHLFSKKPEAAIKPLQAYIEAAGRKPQANEARIHLGNAYLDLKKPTEAYLVSEELLSQADLPNTVRAKALMLRAHAQSGLKQNLESEKTLSVFQNLAENDPELEHELASSYLVTLLLKANHCDALPSAKTLAEDQVVDQLDRKGLCILEMTNQLSRASKRLSDTDLKAGVDALEASWKLLVQTCEQPPLERGKRTKTQFEKAKKELSTKLKESCTNTSALLRQSMQSRENLRPHLMRFSPPSASTQKEPNPG